MQLFQHNRTTRRDDERPRPPPRRRGQVYEDLEYAYAGDAYESRLDWSMMPATPPPPYDLCENQYLDPISEAVGYQQPVQGSEQYLPVPKKQDKRLRKKKSLWASKVDVSKMDEETPYRQQQGWQSRSDLVRSSRHDDRPIVGSMTQTAALCDQLAERVHDVLGRLDHEYEDDSDDEIVNATKELSLAEKQAKEPPRSGFIDFKKTWQYGNSRLPPFLPPMKLYMATWQIVCLAAQASMDVYYRPKKGEREDYVEADWRQNTKAMVIKSRPVDDKNLIVLAIRGSKWNVVDWSVNFRPAPTEPAGFLDDEGNACHAGFLQVAKAMVSPIAARLRHLLEQNPSRASSSLLLTGHSAGGAVASLLYMHMMATSFESELNVLTGCFKRVHCVTFGTPPLTFLPLQNPSGRRYEKNVFMTFANEGDPIVRADRQYLSTLTRIIAAPSPLPTPKSSQGLRSKVSRHALKASNQVGGRIVPVRWDVPPATLSNAGRMVLLREQPAKQHVVEAVQVTDEDLRGVVFGDPEMHWMTLYKRRIDELAIAAVTGRGPG
ncbi:hypothetical protein PRZ48_005828 [Zasmidium cellare]|uniref:Fungal lipase-type domain-containing protein n=1 Tax=Zasmidium cellare TaxID=395010 RepID=A0ABR0ENK6_ZASCE|nr:hypothetical protein PRZ48_005828 [Zasmidium cellare]